MEGMIQQGISDAKVILAEGQPIIDIEEFDDLLDDLNIEETAENRKIAKEKILERVPFYKKLVKSIWSFGSRRCRCMLLFTKNGNSYSLLL